MGHDFLGLGDGEDGFGQAGVEAWQFEFAGGVAEDEVVLAEPAVEGLYGTQAGVLGADGKRVAVGFAVVEEVALVAFEVRLGEFVGTGEAALGGPVEEPLQAFAVACDGAR